MARLQRFRLKGICDTGVEIGKGPYAVIEEHSFRGEKHVGKKIRLRLYQSATPEKTVEILQRFEEECELLSQLDNPNIVKFLGIGTNSTLPSLVLEYLPNSLFHHLESSNGVLPTMTSLSILRDVALGLHYLHEHSPPIIHRNLTANNVLLTTNMSAKISYLGLAKILDLSPADAARMTDTHYPVTVAYMPPETMVNCPRYTPKVDIFSLGVLMVHVLSGEQPIPSDVMSIQDPHNPDKLLIVTEFDRRRSTIEKIEDGHPLLGLIQQCLSNIPDRRPSAVDVEYRLKEPLKQLDSLRRYCLLDIHDTGRIIGRGTYAVVKELNHQAHTCVGKELCSLPYESAMPKDRVTMLQRFKVECEQLKYLRHPNLMKFHGVYLETSSRLPSLVMEYLPKGNLADHLDEHGILPAKTSLGILHDVANGLRFLHGRSIIHYKLTARNVLLTTDMVAKISHFRMAKILGMNPTCDHAYVSPEAMVNCSKYTREMDIFSLGVLMVHVLSGEWPIPSEASTQDPDQQVKVTEFDRRCGTIEKIEKGHPLLGLIQQCLNNIPHHRPDARDVVPELSKVINTWYYDIILLGKTGMGKSTLGNKLLQLERSKIQQLATAAIDVATNALTGAAQTLTGAFKYYLDDGSPSDVEQSVDHFNIADDYPPDDEQRLHSITQECKLIPNHKTKVRILDVPGFFDSKTLTKVASMNTNVSEGNLQTMRQIARAQAEKNLRVRRVVYFLPFRGPPEKADGILQEDLRVMYHFFGTAIFNCMVVVATNEPDDRHQNLDFDDEDVEDTQKTFRVALKQAIRDVKIDCPPIVYIRIADKDVLTTLKMTPVLKEEVLELKFVEGVCSRCSVKFHTIGEEKAVYDFEDRAKPYKDSQCHPRFERKYTTAQTIGGGIGHIATLGIVYAVSRTRGSTIWPGFTNADEACPVCKGSPGSEGCSPVETSVEIPPNETVVVNHTNEL